MSDKPARSKAVRLVSPLGRIDEICDRFETAWRTGKQPRIEDYLVISSSDEGSLPRRELLVELVIIDLEYRWRIAGQGAEVVGGTSSLDPLPQRPSLEDYVACYPVLGSLKDLPEDLIAHERRVRRRCAGPFAVGPGPTNLAVGMDEFHGTERFFLERRIGAGGMGVVYQAYDRERQEVVAIKTMRNVEATAIYRLKREFRSLAGIVHRNLVVLHELFSVGAWWFFTMDFVDGMELLDYVRWGPRSGIEDVPASESRSPASPRKTGWAERVSTVQTDPAHRETERGPLCFSQDTARPYRPTGNAPLTPTQMTRLRSVLKQVVEGISAVHQAGKLHRDVKPSNVLVTPMGRVVLLDFGLATEFERMGMSTTTGNHIVGTIPYMSPEQATVERLSPASDMYSVGVLLYEALTGRHPFPGQPLDVLAAKREKDPPPPSEVVSLVPDDLNRLCIALLRRDPQARPSVSEVLGCLGSVSAEQQVSVPRAAQSSRQPPFVGREQHLSVLADAFATTRRGCTVVAHVRGKAGMGKTALVRRFLDQIRGRHEAVVLAGRCYERESVPFKALDSLVDALSHYLVKLPRLEADALMPRDTLALSEVFPVLRRVEAVAQSRRPAARTPNEQGLRQGAFDGLRELLARLGDRRPLVLYIDDLQWGDLDSVILLKHLLSPPDPPVLLLVVCSRTEDGVTSPALHSILGSEEATGQSIDVRQINVESLLPKEARQLASQLIGAEQPDRESLSKAIARESDGNPYFIDALVRHCQACAQPLAGSRPEEAACLEEMLWAQMSSLPDAACRLLEIVAIAGHPLRQAEACRVAGLSAESHEVLNILRTAHMIHTSGEKLDDKIEVYDERIRDTVLKRISPEAATECRCRLTVIP